MLTLYGTRLCPQCVEALEELNRRGMEMGVAQVLSQMYAVQQLLLGHYPAMHLQESRLLKPNID